MTTITIKRERMRNARPGLRPPGWTYSYTTPEDVTWTSADGATRPGPRAGEFIGYGSGLGSLRDMLRRTYGPNVEIIKPWKAS